MGNYLKLTRQREIESLLKLGWGHRRIARELGVNRETVGRYARLLGGETPDQTQPNPITGDAEVGDQTRPNPITGPPSAAEPYRAQIVAGVKDGLTAQRIWQDLVAEEGFSAGYQSVRRYAYRVRGAREVADHLEHPPGAEAQIDFFKSKAWLLDAGGVRTRPWVFRMTLSCSRHGYEEALADRTMPNFLRAHEHAFLFIGGVPKVVRQDNTKTGVALVDLYDPDIHALYAEFAQHWGFTPLPSKPRHPQEQGVQERSGGYVNENALRGREFASLSEMNEFLAKWNRSIAQQRIHGSTRRQVITHFLETEKPALLPLPADRFDLYDTGVRVVHPDGYVEVGGAYYTAPYQLVGRRLRVRWNERLVRIYDGDALLRTHVRQQGPGSWVTHPDDRPEHKPARQAAYQQNLLARAERVGENTHAWAEAAIVERDVRAYRLLQGVLSLTRTHPRECVDAACKTALDARLFRYKSLRRLTEEEAARTPPNSAQLTQEHELIRNLSEYAALVPGD